MLFHRGFVVQVVGISVPRALTFHRLPRRMSPRCPSQVASFALPAATSAAAAISVGVPASVISCTVIVVSGDVGMLYSSSFARSSSATSRARVRAARSVGQKSTRLPSPVPSSS